MEEIWKEIDGYPNYMISSKGRVKSLERYDKLGRLVKEKILKQGADGGGYKILRLYNDGKHKSFHSHRLVAQAFLDNPYNLPEVNHKDENKQNNCVDNLEWCDKKYNNNYGTKNKRAAKALFNGKRSKKVFQYDLNGNFIKEFPSAAEVQRQMGIPIQNVTSCCRGEYKTTHGYIFSYQSLYKIIYQKLIRYVN